MYQSQIRDSQITALKEKVEKKNYGKYLYKIKLLRVRNFEDQDVIFEFPVTALIGPNGGGKTTILGAAACAYKEIYPRQFFVRSGNIDDGMQNWKIEYELVDKEINSKNNIQRTASFHSSKWSREALSRSIAVLGVSRTVPATERRELRKYASNAFTVDASKITEIGDVISSAVEKILGKDITGYTHIIVDQHGRVSLLAGVTNKGTHYSEFHFGAGESSIIRMVMKIESMPDNSLILIEEIENGLHPVATISMVEYLIEVAERKKIQVIFTTHSEEALKPLPFQAVWAAIDGKVVQGKLDISALRSISGEIDAKLVIFTEDRFSKNWVESMIRAYGGIAVDLVNVHAMEGDGTAVKVNLYHNIDPSAKVPSVCYIDGDSMQEESDEDRVFRLPGAIPESFIYSEVLDVLSYNSGILAVSLHKKYEDAERVSTIIRDIKITNRDPHLLYPQVGRALGLIPQEIIIGGFLNVWCTAYPEKVKNLLDPIMDLLPKEETKCGLVT
jgi:predicted ATPase